MQPNKYPMNALTSTNTCKCDQGMELADKRTKITPARTTAFSSSNPVQRFSLSLKPNNAPNITQRTSSWHLGGLESAAAISAFEWVKMIRRRASQAHARWSGSSGTSKLVYSIVSSPSEVVMTRFTARALLGREPTHGLNATGWPPPHHPPPPIGRWTLRGLRIQYMK